MADFTPNYNLEKPTGAEKYYISKFNANADKIDTALKTQADEISANKTQEEEDVAELEQTLKTYTDNSVSAHNINQQAHPYIQGLIDQALLDAKDYTDSKPNAVEVVAAHNISDSAHSDIRDLISNMGSTTETAIDNAIDLHNVDLTAHPDIRTDAETYTDNAIEEHNNDPDAHGGKQVVYTNLTASGNDFISSMTSLDIQTAFQDGKSVTALLNGGGEIHLTVDNGVVSGTRTVINGDNLILETYTFDNSTVTKTVSKFKLDYAPALVDEAIVDQSVIVDPETTVATIGSAVIGSSTVSSETDSGSDSNLYFVNITYDQNTSSYTSDKTNAEIYQADQDGKTVIFKVIDDSGFTVFAGLSGTPEQGWCQSSYFSNFDDGIIKYVDIDDDIVSVIDNFYVRLYGAVNGYPIYDTNKIAVRARISNNTTEYSGSHGMGLFNYIKVCTYNYGCDIRINLSKYNSTTNLDYNHQVLHFVKLTDTYAKFSNDELTLYVDTSNNITETQPT